MSDPNRSRAPPNRTARPKLGGYFLFKPTDKTIAPEGALGTVYLH